MCVCRHSPPDLQNVCTSDFSVLLQIEVNAIELQYIHLNLSLFCVKFDQAT